MKLNQNKKIQSFRFVNNKLQCIKKRTMKFLEPNHSPIISSHIKKMAGNKQLSNTRNNPKALLSDNISNVISLKEDNIKINVSNSTKSNSSDTTTIDISLGLIRSNSPINSSNNEPIENLLPEQSFEASTTDIPLDLLSNCNFTITNPSQRKSFVLETNVSQDLFLSQKFVKPKVDNLLAPETLIDLTQDLNEKVPLSEIIIPETEINSPEIFKKPTLNGKCNLINSKHKTKKSKSKVSKKTETNIFQDLFLSQQFEKLKVDNVLASETLIDLTQDLNEIVPLTEIVIPETEIDSLETFKKSALDGKCNSINSKHKTKKSKSKIGKRQETNISQDLFLSQQFENLKVANLLESKTLTDVAQNTNKNVPLSQVVIPETEINSPETFKNSTLDDKCSSTNNKHKTKISKSKVSENSKTKIDSPETFKKSTLDGKCNSINNKHKTTKSKSKVIENSETEVDSSETEIDSPESKMDSPETELGSPETFKNPVGAKCKSVNNKRKPKKSKSKATEKRYFQQIKTVDKLYKDLTRGAEVANELYSQLIEGLEKLEINVNDPSDDSHSDSELNKTFASSFVSEENDILAEASGFNRTFGSSSVDKDNDDILAEMSARFMRQQSTTEKNDIVDTLLDLSRYFDIKEI